MLNVTEKTTDDELAKALAAFEKRLATRADLYAELLIFKRYVDKKTKALKRQYLALHAEIAKFGRKVKQSKET